MSARHREGTVALGQKSSVARHIEMEGVGAAVCMIYDTP